MKTRDTQLLTILFQLTDIQIKKYLKLAHIGVGPDAGMNADLVRGEVDELLELAQELLARAEKADLDDKTVERIFSHIKFYLDLEDIRTTASELLDSNNIHNTEYERVQEQMGQLDQLAKHHGLRPTPFKATTPAQKQCEYDSYAIADLILDCALALNTDPKAKIPKGLIQHAASIMQKNAAQGRYKQPDIKKELERGHQHFQALLAESKLEKSTAVLSKETAEQNADAHRTHLQALLVRFDKLVPPASQSSHIQWREVATLRKAEGHHTPPRFKFKEEQAQKKSSCRCSSTFFKAVAWTAAGAVTATLATVALTYR